MGKRHAAAQRPDPNLAIMTVLEASIAAELRQSAKYRDLCDQTIDRIAVDAARRHAKPAEAVKAAKRKLHQIFAAYSSQPSLKHLLRDVERLPTRAENPVAFEEGAEALLNQHASTAERGAAKGKPWSALWEMTGIPSSVVDLACGYHPFALPWMGLPATTSYYAFDIDKRLAAAVDLFLKKANQPGSATCGDLLVEVPQILADVALLFKTLPVLEQQEKDVAKKILRAIPARHIIVSFPLRTLSGREVGMAEAYTRLMQKVIGELEYPEPAQSITVGDEMFFVVSGERRPE
jgi:16S rRNA (guanine(1405)-N(7))-methyltransferase